MATKDNFTDVVENLPKTPAQAPREPQQSQQPASQQVVSGSGETITLGQNQNNGPFRNPNRSENRRRS